MFFQSASTPETTRRLIIKVLLINTVTHFLANTPLMRTAPCEISLAAAGAVGSIAIIEGLRRTLKDILRLKVRRRSLRLHCTSAYRPG
jgi:hypothetical protein